MIHLDNISCVSADTNQYEFVYTLNSFYTFVCTAWKEEDYQTTEQLELVRETLMDIVLDEDLMQHKEDVFRKLEASYIKSLISLSLT
jgi:hypothetical protein